MKLLQLIFLALPLILNAQWNQIGNELVGDNAGDRFGGNISFDDFGNRVAVGAQRFDSGSSDVGLVRVFEYNINNNGLWGQVGADIVGQNFEEELGAAVSLSGDGKVLAIGSMESNINNGKVTVYRETGGVWTQIGNTIDPSEQTIFFAQVMSLSRDGNTLIASSHSASGGPVNNGLVQVYRFDGTSWNQLGQNFYGQATADFLGQALAINADGTRIAMAAPMKDLGVGSNTGRVYVYELDGNSWVQLGQFLEGSTALQEFGRGLSFNDSGDRLAIGSGYFLDNQGGVQTYELIGGSWQPLGQELMGANDDDYFGLRVELNGEGDVLAVGAPGSNTYGALTGYVAVFQFSNGQWFQMADDIPGGQQFETSGVSIGLTKDSIDLRVAIGAFRYGPTPGDETGRVRIYSFDILEVEDKMGTQVALFPNPATDLINIVMKGNNKTLNVSVFDISGKLVYEKRVSDTDKATIVVDQFMAGLYTVVISGDTITETMKFVKN